MLRFTRSASTTVSVVSRRRSIGFSQHASRTLSQNSRDHAFSILGLKSFTEAEIEASFSRLQTAPTEQQRDERDVGFKSNAASVDVVKGIQHLADTEYPIKLDPKAIKKVTELVVGKNAASTHTTMSLAQYKASVLALGERLDPRVWNIGLSFLFTGTSVGIIIPCMPLLVSQLHIPASEFGLVVSAFGLSKLIGNIPSGYFVEKYGRKPSMVCGLGMCGLGLGSIGLALEPGFGTPWLIACRFVSGLGVSGFVAGGYMFMSDISTALNRTRTIAPVMAGFSGGAALGPAVGGVLIDTIGIGATYATVGGLFVSLAAMNGLLLNETKNFNTVTSGAPSKPKISAIIDVPSQPPLEGGDYKINKTTAAAAVKKLEESTVAGVLGSFSTAFAAWKKLLNDPNKQIRNIVTMNGLFWFALSGTQMTLLPLLMVGPRMSDAGTNLGLAMSAGEIGASFAFMSMVSFLFSQPMAYVADKYGKVPTILGGCALLSASMLALPLTTGAQATTIALPLLTSMHLPEYTTALVLVLLPFALGNTALNATPTALMSDLTEPSSRAQALSLLRTAGDCGLLLGASFAGAMAHFYSLETALMTNGALTAATMMWFAAKNRPLAGIFAKNL